MRDLTSLEDYARRDSSEATAHFLLGIGLWDVGRIAEAHAALRRAVAIDPRYADGYLALSYLLMNAWPHDGKETREETRARQDEGQRLGRRAFMINPLVDFPVWRGRQERGTARPSAGRYDIAFAEMEKRASRINERKHPDRVPRELLWIRGLAAAHLANHAVAIRDFESLLAWALKTDSTSTFSGLSFTANQFRYLLAVFNHRAGQLDRAKELYRAAAELDLGLYMAHVQLAGIYTEQGRLDSAVAARKLAVLVNPDDSSVHVELAVTLLQAGQVPAAVEPLQRAAELNPYDARAPYLLGVIAASGGQVDEARRYLTHFLALAPSRMADQVSDARRRLAELP